MNPRYPVYVISKGRWQSRLTVRALEVMRVPYRVVVEPQELESYASVIDRAKILALPFSNLGQGSIPARNWVWEHSIAEGHARHWILDDNILQFNRLNHNLKIPVRCGSTFAAIEDFVDRYYNVAIAGMQYFMFAPARAVHSPLILNTRIYSCILIKNNTMITVDGEQVPLRWRGRYNEDTDLSIRALKEGWSTVLFQSFLADKMTTMTMKGGNTDELYKDDGRLKMAESLRDQHPDIVTISWKWNRWQHQVDYSPFEKNELKLKPGVTLPTGVNNYGMVLSIDGELLTGDERADHARVVESLKNEAAEEKKKREEVVANGGEKTSSPKLKNDKKSTSRSSGDFAADAEKAAASAKITTREWSDALNFGLSLGLSISRVDELVRAKFNAKLRELKRSQLDELRAFLSSSVPTSSGESGSSAASQKVPESSDERSLASESSISPETPGCAPERAGCDTKATVDDGSAERRGPVERSVGGFIRRVVEEPPPTLVRDSTGNIVNTHVVDASTPPVVSPGSIPESANVTVAPPPTVVDEKITSSEWTKLLNVGLYAGKTIDGIDALVREKFSCRTRDLRKSQYAEALEAIK